MDLIFKSKKQTVFDISYCSGLTSQFFKNLANASTKFILKQIRMDGIKCIDTICFPKLFKESKETLELVSLQSCKVVESEAKHLKEFEFCSKIKYINLAGVSGAGDDFFSSFSGGRY